FCDRFLPPYQFSPFNTSAALFPSQPKQFTSAYDPSTSVTLDSSPTGGALRRPSASPAVNAHNAPEAPSASPKAAFGAHTGIRSSRDPNTFFSARSSISSPAGLPDAHATTQPIDSAPISAAFSACSIADVAPSARTRYA